MIQIDIAFRLFLFPVSARLRSRPKPHKVTDLNIGPFHTKISSDLRSCIASNYSILSIVWI